MDINKIKKNVCLKKLTTLHAGGAAEYFVSCDNIDFMAQCALECTQQKIQISILGHGSNILPSDAGVQGLVIYNQAKNVEFKEEGIVVADTGISFQDLFIKTAQLGFGGLEFAVGIPGTLGGALISNAGAYRSQIASYVQSLEVIFQGTREWVSKDWMEFSYRNSRLRRNARLQCILLRVALKLKQRPKKEIYSEARDYQRQRILKQPPQASAGSFFKNVYHNALAQELSDLPHPLKEKGIIPAYYLLLNAGMAGYNLKGAKFSERHANFIVNSGSASATTIRNLAEIAKKKVYDMYQVKLDEEVLYFGDWSSYGQEEPLSF